MIFETPVQHHHGMQFFDGLLCDAASFDRFEEEGTAAMMVDPEHDDDDDFDPEVPHRTFHDIRSNLPCVSPPPPFVDEEDPIIKNSALSALDLFNDDDDEEESRLRDDADIMDVVIETCSVESNNNMQFLEGLLDTSFDGCIESGLSNDTDHCRLLSPTLVEEESMKKNNNADTILDLFLEEASPSPRVVFEQASSDVVRESGMHLEGLCDTTTSTTIDLFDEGTACLFDSTNSNNSNNDYHLTQRLHDDGDRRTRCCRVSPPLVDCSTSDALASAEESLLFCGSPHNDAIIKVVTESEADECSDDNDDDVVVCVNNNGCCGYEGDAEESDVEYDSDDMGDDCESIFDEYDVDEDDDDDMSSCCHASSDFQSITHVVYDDVMLRAEASTVWGQLLTELVADAEDSSFPLRSVFA